MCLRINIRINAQADGSSFADAPRDLVERDHFVFGLDVEH